ncbi:hypothetical protein ACJX0J_030138 [Zea mays]
MYVKFFMFFFSQCHVATFLDEVTELEVLNGVQNYTTSTLINLRRIPSLFHLESRGKSQMEIKEGARTQQPLGVRQLEIILILGSKSHFYSSVFVSIDDIRILGLYSLNGNLILTDILNHMGIYMIYASMVASNH